MEKNWLIRTHLKKILGPVSKEKVLELLEKNTLVGDDEICSGNGFWFFVREKDLLEKYVYNDESQDFGPLALHSTSKTTVSAQKDSDITLVANVNDLKGALGGEESKDEGDAVIPSQDDLEFPDASENVANDQEKEPNKSDLEYPNLSQNEEQQKLNQSDQQNAETEREGLANNIPQMTKTQEKKAASKSKKSMAEGIALEETKKTSTNYKMEDSSKNKKSRKGKVEIVPKRDDRYLYYIMIIIIAGVLLAFYYYKRVFKKPALNEIVPEEVEQTSLIKNRYLPSVHTDFIFSAAYAQLQIPLFEKKKV